VNAVAATANGFVAVGSHGAFQAVWTSSDGQRWDLRDLPEPPGARSATLRLVTTGTSGSLVVAGGYAATRAGDVPVIVASADGGASWRQVVLGANGLVTALTATGTSTGFVAAGLSGAAGAGRAVVWSSRDGVAWSAPAPAGNGVGEITALGSGGSLGTGTDGTGTTVTGTAQQAAGAAVVTLRLP